MGRTYVVCERCDELVPEYEFDDLTGLCSVCLVDYEREMDRVWGQH